MKEKDKDKENKSLVDKNFFNSMNYELAGEIGAIDNEDMIQNKKILNLDKKDKENQKK